MPGSDAYAAGGIVKSGWASSIKRSNVVPERGERTIIGIGWRRESNEICVRYDLSFLP